MKALAACLLLAVVAAASVQAARPARPAERAAILKATRIYIDSSGCCAVISRIKVYSVRVSIVDPRWAVVALYGYEESGRGIGPARAALRKGNLSNRWSVRNFGSIDIGCDMPLRVQRDLREGCS